ncbi:MAG: hypothetical protein ABGY41_10570 [Candidatus Poribacteria bacterium]
MNPAILGIMVPIVGMVVGGAITIAVLISKHLSGRRGASDGELEQMRQQLNALTDNMSAMQETMADMTLMIRDAADTRLPPANDAS